MFTSASLLVTEQRNISGNALVTQSAGCDTGFTMKFLSVEAAYKVSELKNNKTHQALSPKTDWPNKEPRLIKANATDSV